MIDYSVYPDVALDAVDVSTPSGKADYVARICAAWDFDIIPNEDTFTLLSGWQDIFDRYPLPHSPAYAAFRTLFGWPPVPGGSALEADFERLDRVAGRPWSDYSLGAFA